MTEAEPELLITSFYLDPTDFRGSMAVPTL